MSSKNTEMKLTPNTSVFFGPIVQTYDAYQEENSPIRYLMSYYGYQ